MHTRCAGLARCDACDGGAAACLTQVALATLYIGAHAYMHMHAFMHTRTDLRRGRRAAEVEGCCTQGVACRQRMADDGAAMRSATVLLR